VYELNESNRTITNLKTEIDKLGISKQKHKQKAISIEEKRVEIYQENQKHKNDLNEKEGLIQKMNIEHGNKLKSVKEAQSFYDEKIKTLNLQITD
jgi:hypothetical protein